MLEFPKLESQKSSNRIESKVLFEEYNRNKSLIKNKSAVDDKDQLIFGTS